MTRSLRSQSCAFRAAFRAWRGRSGSEALSDSTRGVFHQRRLPGDFDGGGLRLGASEARPGPSFLLFLVRRAWRLSLCRWGASRHLLQAQRSCQHTRSQTWLAGKASGDPWTTLGTTSCPGGERHKSNLGSQQFFFGGDVEAGASFALEHLHERRIVYRAGSALPSLPPRRAGRLFTRCRT